MKVKKRFIIPAVILGVLIIGLGIYKSATKDNEIFKNVTTVKVTDEEIYSEIVTNGILKSKNRVEVVTSLPYTIENIFFDEGDRVNTGDKLLNLNTKDLKYQIKTQELNLSLEKEILNNMEKETDTYELEKSVENSKITYENSKENYEKSKELYKAGAISKSKLETDKSNYIKAKNNYEVQKNKLVEVKDENSNNNIDTQKKKIELQKVELESSEMKLKEADITSPITGTIVMTNAKIGALAAQSNPLYIIEDTDNLEIEVKINEYDISDIKVGQSVTITGDAFRNKEFQGVIEYISPIAENVVSNSGTETNIAVKVAISNKDYELKPGYTAQVIIETGREKSALVVPYEALYRKKDGVTVVFRDEDGIAKEIPVDIGIEGDTTVQIISDEIKKDDYVILNPTENIKDGEKVQSSKGENI